VNTPAPGDARSWYAVHVRSNQERGTASLLEGRGIELFWPTYTTRSKRVDRQGLLVRPLFPGYLFVRIDIGGPERIEVLRAAGAVRIVGFGGEATPVPGETIESLKILVGSGADQVRPHPLVRAGQRVNVLDGPFRGATGVLAEADDRRSRLVVEVEFLGRAVAVPIAADQVQPLFD
jgi:transcription antitermination factor NusG